MSISGPEELEALRAAGAVVRQVLETMKQAVRPGVTTAELDAIGAAVIEENGARSAPATVYGFPGSNCISVNEEAVHGIPSSRVLLEGDLLKLDVTVEKDGFMADAAETMGVGTVEREGRRDGFAVIRELGGHGIGRTIHEEPRIPNYHDPEARRVLTEGLVIAVEPILSAGSGRAILARDGWTMRTADRKAAAHYEHTIVVTRGAPVRLTA